MVPLDEEVLEDTQYKEMCINHVNPDINTDIPQVKKSI
jgi:hypothetical protein